ncbi:hypothetical protein TNCV_2852071 [Trichonephila clavipes]|nr:hypothetical protein TNCV_2852071 [Trichonephila clavipes]
MSTMDVDPTDDENQSPCFKRRMLRSRIATEKMLLKTYQDLKSKFNTSNPSLMETTNTAAAEHQLKLDALVSERDSLPECLTFNCQYCTKSNPTTPVEVNAPVKNSNSFKKVNSDNNESKTSVKVNSKNKKKFKKRKLLKRIPWRTLSSQRKLPDLLLLQSANQSQLPIAFLISLETKTK